VQARASATCEDDSLTHTTLGIRVLFEELSGSGREDISRAAALFVADSAVIRDSPTPVVATQSRRIVYRTDSHSSGISCASKRRIGKYFFQFNVLQSQVNKSLEKINLSALTATRMCAKHGGHNADNPTASQKIFVTHDITSWQRALLVR
jgi:hypothetical protein